MKYLLGFILLFLLSCNIVNIETKIFNQISIIEENKNILNNYNITSLRNTLDPNPLEFMVKRSNEEGYAIIQIKPKSLILKFFVYNPINENFVKLFATINCRFLYCNEKYIIGINIESKNTMIFFKGAIPSNEEYLKEKSKKIDGFNNWNYTIIEN